MKGRYFVLVLLTVPICWRLGHTIFSMDSYQLAMHPLFSSSSKKLIKQIVAQHYQDSFGQLSKQLFDMCPAIKNISVQHCANHQLKISVDAYQPFIQLGDRALLLETGNIVSKHHYTAKSVEQLAQVCMASHVDPFVVSKEFVSWLQHLDEQIIKDFSIIWQDDYEIYLQHKQACTQIILAGVGTPVNGEIIQACRQIVDQKINLGQGTARVSWCADIRFDKQIIVSSHKGGACHG